MNKNDIFKIGIGTWKVDPDTFIKDDWYFEGKPHYLMIRGREKEKV